MSISIYFYVYTIAAPATAAECPGGEPVQSRRRYAHGLPAGRVAGRTAGQVAGRVAAPAAAVASAAAPAPSKLTASTHTAEAGAISMAFLRVAT